ncbi:uncharacterized protein THITE_2127786 [Thermothielavioides terrestris NRRL 8126]|uniref:Uncharacterized protein n=1 Tax=Thermothielavioides terrestris (strain ATCC 38088 / NRRL 8126) TaxID=578455 RepID=G2R0F2_THETT|nr:uncharacterized protein THITE_2127786 [Thermothielavioides terrestris NRRL 8126]AEO65617.1 hypothetical protein THITE_2127786 [Thermothielavioides terrestris NRRL 8126]
MHATRASLRNLMLLAIIGVASAEAVGISRDVAVSAIAWGSLRCPPDGSTNLPTPTYGTEKVVFQVCSQVVINAPTAAVYHALLDFQSYSLWNSFVVDVALPADVRRTPDDVRVGNSMVFTTAGILPLINTTSTEIVTKLLDEDETQAGGYLMAAWRSEDGAGGLLYRAEHPTILVDQGDGTTLSVSYEPYYAGLLTPALRLLQGKLQRLFEQQNGDVKAQVTWREGNILGNNDVAGFRGKLTTLSPACSQDTCPLESSNLDGVNLLFLPVREIPQGVQRETVRSFLSPY